MRFYSNLFDIDKTIYICYNQNTIIKNRKVGKNMNKFFKRVIYGGFIIGSALPMIAHASSLDFGTSSAALAETRIPISVKSDSQAVESVTLSCQTNVDAVDCGFEINGVGVTSNKSGKSVMVSYPNDQNVSKFPTNTSTQIGNVVLTQVKLIMIMLM